LSARNWAFQLLFPSFLSALAVFMTVLVAASVMRRKSTTSTAGPLSRILIAAPCLVILWLAGFYVFRSLIEHHAYGRVALAGVFVVALLIWFFLPDRSKLK